MDPHLKERLKELYRNAAKIPVGCPVCESSAGERILDRDRYDLPVSIDLCAVCGTGYINPLPESGWLDDFYAKHYWDLYPELSFDDEERRGAVRSEQILKAILGRVAITPARCLDAGCGSGGMIRALQEHFPEAQIVATDPSESAIAKCSKYEGVRLIRTNWSDASAEAIHFNPELVTLVHVLEHVPNPAGMLRRLRALMTEDGLLYVEVPDLASRHWQGMFFFHIAHLTYFTEKTLRRLLLKTGFEPIETITGAADEWPWAVGFLARKRPPSSDVSERMTPREAKRHRAQVLAQLGPVQSDAGIAGLLARMLRWRRK